MEKNSKPSKILLFKIYLTNLTFIFIFTNLTLPVTPSIIFNTGLLVCSMSCTQVCTTSSCLYSVTYNYKSSLRFYHIS